MQGIPTINGLSKPEIEESVSQLCDQNNVAVECAIRSMIFLQHIKSQFKAGKVKNGNDLVAAFESGLAALNDD